MVGALGRRFGMMPEDEFEIIAENAGEDFYFNIIFKKDILVYAEGQSDYPGIFQNGAELETGHNRFWEKIEK